MSAATLTVIPNKRGTELLLAHCAVFSRPSASERLSAELGGDLSRRLVQALSGSQRTRFRRGSSSPYNLT